MGCKQGGAPCMLRRFVITSLVNQTFAHAALVYHWPFSCWSTYP